MSWRQPLQASRAIPNEELRPRHIIKPNGFLASPKCQPEPPRSYSIGLAQLCNSIFLLLLASSSTPLTSTDVAARPTNNAGTSAATCRTFSVPIGLGITRGIGCYSSEREADMADTLRHGQRGMLQSCVWTTSKASSEPVWIRLLAGRPIGCDSYTNATNHCSSQRDIGHRFGDHLNVRG